MRSDLTWRTHWTASTFTLEWKKQQRLTLSGSCTLPFLCPPCCSRSLIEHRLSPYIWEWCRKKWLLCPRALLCLGVRASPISYSLPAPSGRWWRAAVALSRAVHWAGFLRQLCCAGSSPSSSTAQCPLWFWFTLFCAFQVTNPYKIKSKSSWAAAKSTPVSATGFTYCL